MSWGRDRELEQARTTVSLKLSSHDSAPGLCKGGYQKRRAKTSSAWLIGPPGWVLGRYLFFFFFCLEYLVRQGEDEGEGSYGERAEVGPELVQVSIGARAEGKGEIE